MQQLARLKDQRTTIEILLLKMNAISCCTGSCTAKVPRSEEFNVFVCLFVCFHSSSSPVNELNPILIYRYQSFITNEVENNINWYFSGKKYCSVGSYLNLIPPLKLRWGENIRN